MRRARLGVGIVVVSIVVGVLLLRVGNRARDAEATKELAIAADPALGDFLACLAPGGTSGRPGAGVAQGLLRSSKNADGCLAALQTALAEAAKSYTPSVQAHLDALRKLDARGAETPEAVCELLSRVAELHATLRAKAGLGASAGAPGPCETAGVSLAAVPPLDNGRPPQVWRLRPELMVRWEDDESEGYALFHDGAWQPVPAPDDIIPGALDPSGPVALVRGTPQRMVEYRNDRWIEVARGPKKGVLDNFRVTEAMSVVGVVHDLDPRRYWTVRAKRVGAPFGSPRLLSTSPLVDRPSCTPPAIHASGHVVIACTVGTDEDRKLVVLRDDGDGSAPTQVVVGGATGTGSALFRCDDSRRLWLRQGGLFGDEKGTVYRSADGGATWTEAGSLPPRGEAFCVGTSLFWVGEGSERGAHGALCSEHEGCGSAHWLGGHHAYRGLDSGTLVVVDQSGTFGVTYYLPGGGPWIPEQYVSVAADANAALLRRGTEVFVRVF